MTHLQTDYYAVLGLAPQSSPEAVDWAWRRAWYRGAVTDAVSEAYAVLSDAERRRRYDALRPRFASGSTPLVVDLEEAFSGTERLVLLSSNGRVAQVKIPPGVDSGTELEVRGRGSLSRYVVVLKAHPRLARAGDDLFRDVPVDLFTMLLGGNEEVQLLGGRSITLRIAPETPSGHTLCVPGQGMPLLARAGVRGNLYLRLQPVLPDTLDARERELWSLLRSLRNPDME